MIFQPSIHGDSHVKPNPMKKVFVFACLALVSALCYGQVLQSSENMEELFKLDVSTMSEFRSRFNAETQEYASNRERALLSLFNRSSEVILKNEDVVKAFVQQVISTGQKFAFTDSLWYAELTCSIRYKSQLFPIKLFLKTEETDPVVGYCRWALCGANGLQDCGLIRPFEMADIDAVDNELRFPSLEERMATDFKNAFGYRSISSEIDQLSIFLFMLQEGLWKVESTGELKYHFLSVPGYVFVVEHSKKARNSGWLISDIAKITKEQSIAYEKILMGIH